MNRDETRQQLEPVNATAAQFVAAMNGAAAMMQAYGEAVAAALTAIGDVRQQQQQPAFRRPAWQRRA